MPIIRPLSASLVDRLAPSLAVLGVPLACQLAAGFNGHVPDSLWWLLVISLWGALTGGALLVLALYSLGARLGNWFIARRQVRPRWHHGVVAGCPAFSASAARSSSRSWMRWS